MCPDLINQEVTTSTIDDDAVTLSKIQNLKLKTVLGRVSEVDGDPQQVILSDDFFCDNLETTLWTNNYDSFKSKVEYSDDCFGIPNNNGFLGVNTSGTGATISNVTVSENGIFGVWSLDTGTTSSGRSVLWSGNGSTGAAMMLGQGATRIKTKVKIPTLSTSGERYKLVFGFIGDSTTSTINDGVYFEYSEASSTAWRYCTSNDGTRTELNTSVSVAANTWVRLEIIINPSGSLVTYVINGTAVGTHITNIPTATTDPVSPVIGIWKSAGSSSRSVQTDYLGFSVEISSSRST